MGDDVRWVGNEGGRGRTTEWSVTPYTPQSIAGGSESNAALGLEEMSRDLGSRDLVAKANGVNRYPSLVDVSIRPGWFYHAWQDDQVRSVANLVDIYFSSVGRNSVLLLNIPPDRRGIIHEIDAERIEAFGNYLAQNFNDNLIDGTAKYWRAHKGDCREFKVRDGAIINTLLLQEDISRGQRVESFKVEALTNGRWQHLTSGTTIGYKRLLRFSDCRAERIRVTIDECRSTANIANVALYQIENLEDKNRVVVTSKIATDEWKVVGIDSHEAIDNNLTTVWRSEGLMPMTIDMGEVVEIEGFCYAPAAEGGLGTIFRYNFAVSLDGVTWSECITDGEFSNIKHNPIPYYVNFGRSYAARYLRLEPLREIDDNSATSVAERGVLLAR